jgi:hypothetical protein
MELKDFGDPCHSRAWFRGSDEGLMPYPTSLELTSSSLLYGSPCPGPAYLLEVWPLQLQMSPHVSQAGQSCRSLPLTQ